MNSLRERTQELRQINREFGETMRKNMTVKERLETIQKFHERRKRKVREIMKKAVEIGPSEIGPSEKAGRWINKVEKQVKGIIQKENKTGQGKGKGAGVTVNIS